MTARKGYFDRKADREMRKKLPERMRHRRKKKGVSKFQFFAILITLLSFVSIMMVKMNETFAQSCGTPTYGGQQVIINNQNGNYSAPSIQGTSCSIISPEIGIILGIVGVLIGIFFIPFIH